jgi:hypothetical protein
MSADNNATTRSADTIPGGPREPSADVPQVGDDSRNDAPAVVEAADDHEEAGYGYGV